MNTKIIMLFAIPFAIIAAIVIVLAIHLHRQVELESNITMFRFCMALNPKDFDFCRKTAFVGKP